MQSHTKHTDPYSTHKINVVETQHKKKNTTLPLHIGDSLINKNEGQRYIVELLDINTNDFEIKKYSIKFLHRNTKVVTKEFLNSRNVTDTASI